MKPRHGIVAVGALIGAIFLQSALFGTSEDDRRVAEIRAKVEAGGTETTTPAKILTDAEIEAKCEREHPRDYRLNRQEFSRNVMFFGVCVGDYKRDRQSQ